MKFFFVDGRSNYRRESPWDILCHVIRNITGYMDLLTLLLIGLKLGNGLDISWFMAVFPTIIKTVVNTSIVIIENIAMSKVNKKPINPVSYRSFYDYDEFD